MKIKQIVFGSQAFRMLSNMKLEIADRITVIAGLLIPVICTQ